MCGIAGFTYSDGVRDLRDSIVPMLASLESRGPDASGIWSDDTKIVLGHRRLSIVDLSSAGSQPVISKCKRFVISFNGEIYNHQEIRALIEAKFNFKIEYWSGYSDTETLIESISLFGLTETLSILKGMFAFAVWDTVSCKLHLVRDRFGEKPLFYSSFYDTEGQKHLVFSSTINSLTCCPAISNKLDLVSIQKFLGYGYFPGENTIYSEVKKILPGSVLSFSTDTGEVEKLKYWSAHKVAANAKKDMFTGTLDEAKSSLRDKLSLTIKEMSISDVSLGAFLSGGIDSSLVVSIMQSVSSNPVKTFSIGFDEVGFDESQYAKKVSDFLGTDHTEFRVNFKDAIEILDDLPKIYGEPFGDPSALPTILVSRLAKPHVTVCLTGDSGDEVFGGYNRYVLSQRYWRLISFFPLSVRKIFSNLLSKINYNTYTFVFRTFYKIILKPFSPSVVDKFLKAIRILPSSSVDDLYDRLVRHDHGLKLLKTPHLSSSKSQVISEDFGADYSMFNAQERMMLRDTVSYMCDDVLCKVDRASMASSVETRVPFLDHVLFEFAWRLPHSFKISNGHGKIILKKLLSDFLPKKLFDRPKMGFGVPIGDWLRGPLKDWACDVLSHSNIDRYGVLDSYEVQRILADHLTGRRNYQYVLWNILMLQLWLNSTRGKQ